METWELWFGEAAAAGLPFARSKIEPAEAVLVHSAPPSLEVIVTDAEGRRTAHGRDLQRTAESPMCRLVKRGDEVVREDVWPGEADIGEVVLLPGGEAGHLCAWWHAPDQLEWRWRVEFYNKKS
ncbi:MAG: hypothetical protein MUC34_16485 [Anaerolineae bacterium]|nr:hypothetical protein [Anaerolineae bacterium]